MVTLRVTSLDASRRGIRGAPTSGDGERFGDTNGVTVCRSAIGLSNSIVSLGFM